jgi:hypothetical protein
VRVKSYKENIHYYKLGDRVVFTALFHIQRGSCCGNGCTHCPYDPKYKKGSVVLAEKFIKFTNMNLNDLEKQLQELQKIDPSTLTPERLQELVDKLLSITDIGEELLHNDVQEMENEDDDDSFEDYLLDIKNYNENKSYDNETNN